MSSTLSWCVEASPAESPQIGRLPEEESLIRSMKCRVVRKLRRLSRRSGEPKAKLSKTEQLALYESLFEPRVILQRLSIPARLPWGWQNSVVGQEKDYYSDMESIPGEEEEQQIPSQVVTDLSRALVTPPALAPRGADGKRDDRTSWSTGYFTKPTSQPSYSYHSPTSFKDTNETPRGKECKNHAAESMGRHGVNDRPCVTTTPPPHDRKPQGSKRQESSSLKSMHKFMKSLADKHLEAQFMSRFRIKSKSHRKHKSCSAHGELSVTGEMTKVSATAGSSKNSEHTGREPVDQGTVTTIQLSADREKRLNANEQQTERAFPDGTANHDLGVSHGKNTEHCRLTKDVQSPISSFSRKQSSGSNRPVGATENDPPRLEKIPTIPNDHPGHRWSVDDQIVPGCNQRTGDGSSADTCAAVEATDLRRPSTSSEDSHASCSVVSTTRTPCGDPMLCDWNTHQAQKGPDVSVIPDTYVFQEGMAQTSVSEDWPSELGSIFAEEDTVIQTPFIGTSPTEKTKSSMCFPESPFESTLNIEDVSGPVTKPDALPNQGAETVGHATSCDISRKYQDPSLQLTIEGGGVDSVITKEGVSAEGDWNITPDNTLSVGDLHSNSLVIQEALPIIEGSESSHAANLTSQSDRHGLESPGQKLVISEPEISHDPTCSILDQGTDSLHDVACLEKYQGNGDKTHGLTEVVKPDSEREENMEIQRQTSKTKKSARRESIPDATEFPQVDASLSNKHRSSSGRKRPHDKCGK